MNKAIKISLAVLLVSVLLFTKTSCSKSTEEKECKECKAFNSDGQVIAKETVCGDDGETNFRNAHPGKEVSCH